MLTQEFNIDIIPGGVPIVIHVTQHEVGLRTYIFHPFTSAGEATPVIGSATLEGTKPDGNIIVQNCQYNATTGEITYTMQEQLAAVVGKVWSKLTLRDTSGNAIGYAAIIWVVDMAGVQDGAIASDSDISALAEFINEFGTINAYKAALDGALAAVGGPYVASTVSQMTDRTKVYVYTGSQSGYTAGHWYYWNGSAWTDGGVYQAAAVETDKTLTVADMPADAKATGDAVAELKNDLNQAIKDFAVPTQEAVDNWLDDHPEATTTVQDGSLTLQKFKDDELPFVTPEQFGAKGNGVVDDTAAITSAFNYLIENDVELWFMSKNYRVSSSVNITGLNNRKINFGESRILLDSSEQIKKAFSFFGCNNLIIDGGNFISERNQTGIPIGSHTRKGTDSSNVHCLNFYGCENVTITNSSFDSMEFDVYFGTLTQYPTNSNFTIFNINSVNASVCVDAVASSNVSVIGSFVSLAENLGLGDHAFYFSRGCYRVHITDVHIITDGYCGSAFQFWDSSDSIEQDEYIIASVDNCVVESPQLITARHTKPSFNNIRFLYVPYAWETGSDNTIRCARDSKIVVKNSEFIDGNCLFRVQTDEADVEALFENCIIRNYKNQNGIFTSMGGLTLSAIGCVFEQCDGCIAYNASENCVMKLYNCKIDCSYFVASNRTDSGLTGLYHCTIYKYKESVTGNVFYNGSATTAPIEFVFCDITGWGRMSSGTYNLKATNTYLNDVLVA